MISLTWVVFDHEKQNLECVKQSLQQQTLETRNMTPIIVLGNLCQVAIHVCERYVRGIHGQAMVLCLINSVKGRGDTFACF